MIGRGPVVWVAGLAALLAASASAFDLQGHRGARGLAPENTLAAFRKALAIGVTTIETDLAVTRDDVVVISHDPDLNPAIVRKNGSWLAARGPAIRTLTAAELAAYDVGRVDAKSSYARNFPLQEAADGERFPTLAELIALVKETPVRLDVETKITPTSGDNTADPETFARLLVAQIKAAGLAQRTTVQSFDWRTLLAVKRMAPEIATSCLTAEGLNPDTMRADASGRSPWHAGLALADYGGSVPKLVRAAGCGTWSANFASLTRERIAEAHAEDVTVLAWTVNDPAEMAKLIDLGVDGIITDYPDRLREVMRDKGLALPGAVPRVASP